MPSTERTLWLGEPTWTRHQLSLLYGLDDFRFEIAIWYSEVDLRALEQAWGRPFLERLFFHVQLVEASKLLCLRPTWLDPRGQARFFTPEVEELWRTLIRGVWAQWRYENDLPEDRGPRVVGGTTAEKGPAPIHRREPAEDLLLLCGGGKDSLVAMQLLERADQAYSSLAYSSSVYGMAQAQHRLIDGLLDHGKPRMRYRQWIYDSAIEAPLAELEPDLLKGELIAAETPSSIFATLPLALSRGIRHLVVAHERSANVGNLVWDATGEDVNHQWGKSFEAEVLMNRYIQRHLVADVGYFSLLQPIHDAIIFTLLRRDLEAVPATHSCNRQKPWCGRCPKCAYVGLGYLAYLPRDLALGTLGGNPLDAEENLLSFRQMLGLEEHTPFECIGQVPETRLAFELCRLKGVEGRAMDVYREAFPRLDVDPILDRYLAVDGQTHGLPTELASKILRQFDEGAREARAYVEGLLRR